MTATEYPYNNKTKTEILEKMRYNFPKTEDPDSIRRAVSQWIVEEENGTRMGMFVLRVLLDSTPRSIKKYFNGAGILGRKIKGALWYTDRQCLKLYKHYEYIIPKVTRQTDQPKKKRKPKQKKTHRK